MAFFLNFPWLHVTTKSRNIHPGLQSPLSLHSLPSLTGSLCFHSICCPLLHLCLWFGCFFTPEDSPHFYSWKSQLSAAWKDTSGLQFWFDPLIAVVLANAALLPRASLYSSVEWGWQYLFGKAAGTIKYDISCSFLAHRWVLNIVAALLPKPF